MKSICSMETGVGVGLPLSGVTVTGSSGLQRPVRATTAATGPLGLPGRRENFRPKAYQNYPKRSPTCCVLQINRNQ